MMMRRVAMGGTASFQNRGAGIRGDADGGQGEVDKGEG
jgi:hypothetical protein